MNLKTLRKQIDSLDAHIVNDLDKRLEITLKIRNIKKKLGKGIYSPEREYEVLQKLKSTKRGLLPDSALEAIYREVMSSALSLEKPLAIAYLGPEATFTHLAAIKRFGLQLEYIPCFSISDVFKEVERGSAHYGVVPIENSIEGAITHTMDMLIDSDLKICSQIVMNVSHNLLSRYTKEKITAIYSKPEVFSQCRLWLRENFPKADLIDAASTSRAAQIVKKEKNAACIASTLAAKVYQLRVVAANIEDSPSNITRFLVIGTNGAGPTGNDKTSVVFSIKDKVGALHDMLVPFKKYRINLTKIESRPSKKKAWDYYFFVDLEGHIQDKNVARALESLEHYAKYLKILGSYPNVE
ncbi:MAG: prephenate dehydratase [Omnitrophica WOR_2 bacterium GWF2_43_52]|nr:MAG: prephenate dehydratase [Omnitrophica WOR_2 bacterium GWA2_44_7]OGX17029.1 MAG: prephenate dehydratase [Omnitrophica WOR_2 bacterium GWC2_44_8]OGX20994.1 MAG: prephenate dehydratase [Omnitrophica WOR_2 bacterium GWF2_43_52]HAH21173.1 prephenate dehydratase [Candidatus Omnitrophota bacterium]HBG63225.1 prephenate dehydratase [Candidatus Omnitrophota bacterium]